MNTEISNDFLRVTISDRGGELQSIRTADETEYLWQGSEPWQDRAPNLFPYIGRLTEGSYTVGGRRFSMDIHGFLKDSTLRREGLSQASVEYGLESDGATLLQYPFEFSFRLGYELRGPELVTRYTVYNIGEEMMYFGVGGHPGLRVPNQPDLAFEDYYLAFEENSKPLQVRMSLDCFVAGGSDPLILDGGNRLTLRQSLFDNDAILLKNAGHTLTLASEKGHKSLTVRLEDFPYLGIWNWPTQDVDYVCIEPWTSLPSRKGVVEALEEQKDLIALAPGCERSFCWSVIIK